VDGWQELVSNMVASAIWPIVVLILGLTFRKTLKSLLLRLKGFEGLGAKLELSEAVKQLDEAAATLEVQESQNAAPSDETSDESSGIGRNLPLNSLIEVARLKPGCCHHRCLASG
jgi:hypothetical protein